jgi:hypothetical protein
MSKKSSTPVLVTTAHRGVFFGYLESEPSTEKILLSRARNCVQWSTDLRGFGGLAVQGPSQKCRVGPAMSTLTLYDITSIAECTPEAVEAWEQAPWH